MCRYFSDMLTLSPFVNTEECGIDGSHGSSVLISRVARLALPISSDSPFFTSLLVVVACCLLNYCHSN